MLLTAAGVALLALGALSVLPKKYTSEATLVVVQQAVPERYVTPTATTDIAVVLEAATQEVLSRTRLLAIIAEFNLYPEERMRLSPEALEAKMRKEIKIEPIVSAGPTEKEIDAFKISFTTGSPKKAQEVATRLTKLFIEQNLQTREHQSAVTTGFLKEQVEDAKAKLAHQEELIRDFKLKNLGELPEQQNGNLALLSSLQGQLQSVMASEAHAQEQQVYLQSLLNGYRSLAKEDGAAGIGEAGQIADPLLTAKKELANLRAKKASLLAIYTPQYPGILELNTQIAQAEAELKTLQAERTSPDSADKAGEPGQESAKAIDLDPAIAPVKSQIEANRLERENLAKEKAELKQQIGDYQRRLNLTPVREQQLAGLLRDEQLLKADYTDLLSKETQSQLAGSLEKRQEGQQFRLVDSPSLPRIPSFPKPLPMAIGGLVGGIGLGLALAFLLDKKDGYLYEEDDLIAYLPDFQIVAIPVLTTQSEESKRTWHRVLEWAAGSVVVLAVLATEAYELLLKAT